ncbi:MAG: MFS transporter [Gammaproteobacteria bacterium]|nr:MFS transporter [Gammaproteobacteria bacterium]
MSVFLDTADSVPAGVNHSRNYLAHLLFFICFCTLFEGYDVLILNLALPHLGREFGASAETLSYAVGLISVGTMVAFALVRLADRYGRRAVFLGAVAGYTLFTMLTACSTGVYDFVAYQFVARMFMVTEIGVGAIILTEEMPHRYRGAAVTLVFALGLAGGIAGSLLYPYIVETALGWRTLYIAGGAVFPVLAIYWKRLRETRRWQLDQQHNRQPRVSFLAGYREIVKVFHSKYRARLLVGTSIWFALNAWSASCLFFFTYYVTNERGWSAAQVSTTLTFGYMFAIVGYLMAGPMLELAGRRITVSLYFAVGAVSAITCFLSESTQIITVSYMVVLGMQALWAIAATITSEIFPTELRGTGNAVVNNLLGRTGMVLAPGMIGVLSVWLGSVGQAVAVMALVPLFCIPVILLLLKETKGKTLEEIA